jgi:hypothetical protein
MFLKNKLKLILTHSKIYFARFRENGLKYNFDRETSFENILKRLEPI